MIHLKDCDKNSTSGLLEWNNDCLLFEEIRELNTLTFNCDLQIINVYDIQENCVVYGKNNKSIEQLTLSVPQYFEWKVSPKLIINVATASSITSETFTLFGMKWHFTLILKP